MANDGGRRRIRRRWRVAAAGAALLTTAACAGPVDAGDPPPASARATGAVITETGVLVPVLRRDGPITWVRTPCWNTVAIRSGRPVSPRPDVVLDPGHGGPEEGAVGPNGLRERDVNRAVTDQVAAQLRHDGYRVVVLHDGRGFTTIRARAELASALQPRAFVSIHHNASARVERPDPGTEAYAQVSSPASHRLAEHLATEVHDALARYPITWSGDDVIGVKTHTEDDGTDYYGVLRYTQGVPSVILESAFVTSPPEAELLAGDEARRTEADAVVRAIEADLTEAPPADAGPEPAYRPFPDGPPPDAAGCVDPQLEG